MDKLMPAKAERDDLLGFLDGLAETSQVLENGYKQPVAESARGYLHKTKVAGPPHQDQP